MFKQFYKYANARPSDASNEEYYGPYLRFNNCDTVVKLWRGSVMIVTASKHKPTLILKEQAGNEEAAFRSVDPILLEKFIDNSFWKFPLEIAQTRVEKRVSYLVRFGQPLISFDNVPQDKINTFYVPKLYETMNWCFYSCNGRIDSSQIETADAFMPGVQPMWLDLISNHELTPFHLCVGTGDQIYADAVWNVDCALKWLDDLRQASAVSDSIKAAEERTLVLTRLVTKEQQDAFDRFYFDSYYRHFQEPVFSKILASIPQLMVWDDHDIFDGYGSFPLEIQNSPFVQAIFKSAKRFYLLFQQHASLKLEEQGSFGDIKSASFLKSIDPATALFTIDMRSERTVEQVVPPCNYEFAFWYLDNNVPKGLKHLIVILPIPIVWPELGENVIQKIGEINVSAHLARLFQKSKCYENFFYPFGEWSSYMDDIIDQWGSKQHRQEKEYILRQFELFAKRHDVRVTFISGDSHTCGVGRTVSLDSRSPLKDHRMMYNITASAISNNPPPSFLVTLWNLTCSFSFKIVSPKHGQRSKAELMDAETHAYVNGGATGCFSCITCSKYIKSRNKHSNKRQFQFFNLFTEDVDGRKLGPSANKIMGRRNWCQVQSDETGSLQMTIHVDANPVDLAPVVTAAQQKALKPSRPYSLSIPVLSASCIDNL